MRWVARLFTLSILAITFSFIIRLINIQNNLSDITQTIGLWAGFLGIGIYIQHNNISGFTWFRNGQLIFGFVILTKILTWIFPDVWIFKICHEEIGMMLLFIWGLFWTLPQITTLAENWCINAQKRLGLFMMGISVLFCLAQLHELLQLITTLGILIVYSMIGAHAYKGLKDQLAIYTLVAHWMTLALLLFVFALSPLKAFYVFEQETAWNLQHLELIQSFHSFLLIALLFGIINHISAKIRYQNTKVTGFIPFWLFGFSVFISGILQLIQVLPIPLEMTFLIKNYETLIKGILVIACIIYLLGFFARYPTKG